MDLTKIQNLYMSTPVKDYKNVVEIPKNDSKDFSAIFDAALNTVSETDDLVHKADQESMRFILGEADNSHDMMIAQQKAAIALQYTVAVKDKFLQSYQTITNMQI